MLVDVILVYVDIGNIFFYVSKKIVVVIYLILRDII